METKELIKQFTESFEKRGKEYEKQGIKLRRLNKKKYCLACRETVEIDMKGLDGFCPLCKEKLYSIDVRREKTGKK